MTCGITRIAEQKEIRFLDITLANLARDRNTRETSAPFVREFLSRIFFCFASYGNCHTPKHARLRFYFLGQSAVLILRASRGREMPRRRGYKRRWFSLSCANALSLSRSIASNAFLFWNFFFFPRHFFATPLYRAPRDYRKQSMSLTVADYFPAVRSRYVATVFISTCTFVNFPALFFYS